MIRPSAARTSLALASTLGVAAVLAATALGHGSATAAPAATPTLVGTVGPGFTISLKMNNKAVKSLKAGTYKLIVHDKSSIHAFSLDGPKGYAKDFTQIPAVETKTFTVKLKAGSFKYYCPAHESIMFGHFTAK
jgi:plastocyanin